MYPPCPQYTVTEIHRYMVDCMTSVGTPKEHASALADVLLEADRRGHYSHGLNRLGKEGESLIKLLQ